MTHLDDDALSAHLDGEGDAATAAHLDGCAECRARLAQLRAAADAIGGSIPAVDEVARRRAISAALGDAPARPRRAVPSWVAAAAAVVVLLLAAIPVVSSLRDDDTTQSTALRKAERSAGDIAAFGAPDDLGPQSDPAALRQLLEERLTAPVPSGAEAPLAAQTRDGDDTGAADESTASGAAGGGGATGGSSVACLTEARAAGSDRVGSLLYVATLQWETRPALVFVFQAPDPSASTLTRWAFVLARQDCQLLVAQSF